MSSWGGTHRTEHSDGDIEHQRPVQSVCTIGNTRRDKMNTKLPASAPNPYAAVNTEMGYQPSRSNVAWTGVLWSVGFAIPLSALMGLVFRFPVPFVGYVSGFDAILPSMIGVLFYGVALGGFIVIGVLGAIAAITVAAIHPEQAGQRNWIRLISLVITTACLFCLAILDKVIGPW